jgi:cyclic pyranopterin phosphate synthase
VTCLFAAGGRDLTGPLRAGATDDELIDLMTGVWRRRTDRYSEERADLPRRTPRRIEMYQVGG